MPKWSKQNSCIVYRVIPNAAHHADQDNPAFTNQAIAACLREKIAGESHWPKP